PRPPPPRARPPRRARASPAPPRPRRPPALPATSSPRCPGSRPPPARWRSHPAPRSTAAPRATAPAPRRRAAPGSRPSPPPPLPPGPQRLGGDETEQQRTAEDVDDPERNVEPGLEVVAAGEDGPHQRRRYQHPDRTPARQPG